MNLEVFGQFAKKEKGRVIGKNQTAVIYTRVSSKEQFDNNASLTTQLKYCQEYALRKELEVLEYFGGTYESAKSDERREFQRMLNYVKRRKNIGYIIVYSYDRFSRTGANGAYISEQLKKQGVAVISATQEIDVTTSAGNFQENLYHMFSHFDNQVRRDKSITGMQEKLRRGHWTGAYPFGYTNTNPGKGKTPNFVITEEGKLLKQAFLWKANANMSHVEIAKRLKEKGLYINAKKLTDLFRNPFYCGLIVNRLIPGEVVQGKHEALISKEVFLKIHNLLHTGDSPKKYSYDDENLPLKMFVRSSICKTPYTGFKVKAKGLYYYKNRRKGSKENRSAKKLHEEFLDVLGRYTIADKKYIEPLTEIIHDTLLDKNQEALEDQKRLVKELNQVKERIDILERRFVLLNEITKSQYDLFMPELKAEQRELEMKLENSGINSSNLKKSVKLALGYACNLPSMWKLGDLETKRAIQFMVFPEGIGYDFKNRAVQTFRVNEIFAAIRSFSMDLKEIKKGTSYSFCRKSPLVTETGFKPTSNQRFKVYLTNSLEEHHQDTGTLFANWLSTEANEANHIKRDTPVMCVIGNPPYSGISSNNGEWISNLIEDYKYVDGVHFNERKHWLNDDYVKFLRYGQHFIEKNGSGVLAFINPHGFLDNPTFRGMRWHLLRTYDKIYTIDLHGNSKKEETAPDGSLDQNVFDIMQGVSINIFVKTGNKKSNELGKVFHSDLFGKRDHKYQFLSENSIKSIEFEQIAYTKPNYFFIPRNQEGRGQYEVGFRLDDLYPNKVTGIVTMGDNFIVADSKKQLLERLNYLLENDVSEQELKSQFKLGKNYAKWIVENKQDLEIDETKIIQYDYRPFDKKWTYFDNKVLWRWRYATMSHFFDKENIGLMICRQTAINSWEHVGITTLIADDSRVSNRSKERAYITPLYLYPETNGQQTIEQTEVRTPNLKAEIVNQIAEKLGLTFTNEKEATEITFAPIDILDYIYAVLHSPTYREKYKEFLKIDFPRVPYPKDQDTFWQLVKLGGEIRQIHLLESPKVEQYITQYPMDGDNVVIKPKYKDGKVYINDTQYFDNVPQVAWEFYIGGYQPAQKWLKDRKERKLEFDDILHYQKIIVALSETDRLMKEIDKIEIE